MPRYFEDIETGRTYDIDGEYDVTAEEIKSFAERYDPQPFHLDEDAASESMLGSLSASGWHTASMCMRLLVEGFLDPESSMGGKGLDELRWLQPVHPGDTLRVEVEVLDKRLDGEHVFDRTLVEEEPLPDVGLEHRESQVALEPRMLR